MKKLFYFLMICWSFSYSQRTDFTREDITFRLDGRSMDTEGYYWFLNTTNTVITSDIFYPFPSFAGETIDSIRLMNISAGQKIRYNRDGNTGITFKFLLMPHDTILLQIGYRQGLCADSAVYILQTTQQWNKPLQHAEYKLIIPDSLVIKKFSYLPQRSYKIQNEKIFYWEMNNFMPTRDMVFYY